MANEWTNWRRLQTKRTELLAQLEFLKKCRNKKLTPQSARIRVHLRGRRSIRTVEGYNNKIVAAMIQDIRTILDQVSYDCYLAHLKLAKVVNGTTMDEYVTRVHYTMITINNSCRNKHQKKMDWLIRKLRRSETTEEIEPNGVNFHNLANIVLTQEEQDALRLGPKFCFKEKLNYKKLITEIEGVVAAVPNDMKDGIRGRMAEVVDKYVEKRNRKEEKARKVLKNLKEKNDIAIVKTDKSQQIAIINKKEYSEKLQRHIETTKCKKIKRDPTASIKGNLTKILKEKDFPKEIANQIKIPSNSTVPLLFGRIKTHKDGNPARPVVARCMAPTYILEKVLTKLIAPIFKEHQYTVTSTQDVVSKLKSVQITADCKMHSLDIVSLFPSTPVDLALKLISKRMIEEGSYTINQIASIMKSLRLVTESNFFKHEGNIYQQQKGAPMGSPISALLAEVVLQHIEKEAMLKLSFKPKLYCRYVDDCLVITEGEQNIQELKDRLEEGHQDIKFTKEEEVEGKLAFLDLCIAREENKLNLSIYRKPTAPTQIIRNDSYHPRAYKLSAFKWYSKRAEKYCTEEKGKEEEKEYIKKIGLEHGYKKEEIPVYREVNREGSKLENITEKKDQKYRAVTYIPGLSERISQIARKAGIVVAHKCGNNVFDMIRKDRDITPQLEQQGVYRIPIINKKKEVVTEYVGLSTRKISERIKEHRKDVRKEKGSNAIARYVMANNDTTPDWERTERIASHNNKTKIQIREGIEIQYAKTKICNMDPGIAIHCTWNRFLGPKTFTMPNIT